MPQPLTRPDVGFDTPVQFQLPAAPPPKPEDLLTTMGNLGQAAVMATSPGGLAAGFAQHPGLAQAAFEMSNDVVNAVDYLSRPDYKYDPNFDMAAAVKKAGLWDQYRDNFVGARNEAEFNDIAMRIARENRNRQIINSAGPAGVVANVIAGGMSPTVLLPFVGEGVTGVKALFMGAGAGLLTGVTNEAALQLNQETRPAEDSVWNIAMSTVVGGVLGGAVGYLSRPIEDVANDMAHSPGVKPIQPFADIGTAKSVGAAENVRPYAGGMKPALGQEDEFAGQIGPATQNFQASSPQGRWMTAQLADAGVQLEGNAEGIPTALGGTAENRIKTYNGALADTYHALDDAYAKYYYEREASTPGSRVVANNLGVVYAPGKLSRADFKEQVAWAMEHQDQHDIPQVAEAAANFRKLYDDLYQKAQEAGIYAKTAQGEGDAAPLGAESYINRDYNTRAIQAKRPEFLDMLSGHFQEKLQSQFQSGLEKVLAKQQRTAERVADFQLPPDRVKAIRQEVEAQKKALIDSMTPEEQDLQDFMQFSRSIARDRTQPKQVRQDAADQLKIFEKMAGTPEAQARKAQIASLDRRLKSLNRARFVLEEKRLKKLIKIDRMEELSLNSMNRVVRSAQKFLSRLDKLSDEQLNEGLSELRNRFAKMADTFDRAEERINGLVKEGDVGAGDKLFGQEMRQEALTGKLSDISAELEAAEQLDRGAARQAVQDALDETLARVNRINGRRAIRAQRLEEDALKVSPERVQAEIDKLQSDTKTSTREFLDSWEQRGAEAPRAEPGFRPNFKAAADQIAERVTTKILGTNARLAGQDLLMEDKGVEIARMLDVPSEKIWPYLEHDVEHLSQQYLRTLAPDIEIRRALGEYAPDMGGRNLEFTKLNEEETARTRELQATMQAQGKSPEQITKATLKLADEYTKIRRNLEAIIGRLRHTWGVPSDPMALSARAGRIAMNLNVLRYMNMVLWSSISDIAQPIMKYGITKTFGKGWVPYIKGLTQGNFTQRELKLAGAALDMTLHGRAHTLMDMGDIMVRGSKFEKGLQYASNKIGIVAAFDIWTTAMKQVAGAVANAQLVDDIRLVMEGGGGKEFARAVERLASLGYDNAMVEATWKELSKPGGSNIVNGVMWPNTESWDNAAGAVDAYRAAMVKSVDDTIITPGVGERPKWTDSSLTGRLLWQFKSFAASSTTKTYLAGLQKRDAAVAYGAMISVALGTLSYYISAKIAGGTTEAQMEAALAKGDWGHFTDEGISRSGLLAIFGSILDVLSTIPGTPHVGLGTQRTQRTAANDTVDQIGGPSWDLLQHAIAATGGLAQGKFNRTTAHNIRLMLPLQNHFLLRRFFNEVEKAFPE